MSSSTPPQEPDGGDYRDRGPLPSYQPDPASPYAGSAADDGRLPPPAAQPPSIRTAVRLMWAGAALTALSLLISLVTLSSLKSHVRDQLAKSNPKLTASDINAAYDLVVALSVISAVIAIALWLWMAWKNGQGRAWARIVSTVLGALNLLYSVYTLAIGRSLAVSEVLTVIDLILAIAIVVLLWRRESSDFYAASGSRPAR